MRFLLAAVLEGSVFDFIDLYVHVLCPWRASCCPARLASILGKAGEYIFSINHPGNPTDAWHIASPLVKNKNIENLSPVALDFRGAY